MCIRTMSASYENLIFTMWLSITQGIEEAKENIRNPKGYANMNWKQGSTLIKYYQGPSNLPTSRDEIEYEYDFSKLL